MRSFLKYNYLYLSWVVSLVATGGSLFLSEVMHFNPCNLCWYQRILMYPLIYLLGRGALKQDNKVVGYALPFSILGFCIALYHYGKQQLPWLDQIAPCKVGIPCSTKQMEFFGFITIPFMSMVAFLIISVMLIIGSRLNKNR